MFYLSKKHKELESKWSNVKLEVVHPVDVAVFYLPLILQTLKYFSPGRLKAIAARYHKAANVRSKHGRTFFGANDAGVIYNAYPSQGTPLRFRICALMLLF